MNYSELPPIQLDAEILKMVLSAVSKGNLRKSQAGYFRNRDGILPPEYSEYKKKEGQGEGVTGWSLEEGRRKISYIHGVCSHHQSL